jgi:hypothetical protein
VAPAGKLVTESRGTYSESTEGSSTVDWLHPLYHRGGDPHQRGSTHGYIFLHDCPTIILFNSEALYDFMSSKCGKKAKLSLIVREATYVISTPGGRVAANRIVRKVSFELAGKYSVHTLLY